MGQKLKMVKEEVTPTVDLSAFFMNDEDGKNKAKEILTHACSEYGFFQVVNHGVPLNLMNQALHLSKTFFGFSWKEKIKAILGSGVMLPPGSTKELENPSDKNEYFLTFHPGSILEFYPMQPPEFRHVLKQMFYEFRKLGMLVESILNDCLGLPPDFLKEYNDDRSEDYMVARRYFPATKTENSGLCEHEDANVITFMCQDVDGLEFLKNGEWIPVIVPEGSLIVNVGDIIQVLSNNKFKSATHRVVRKEGRDRHSYVYCYSLNGDKWVKPLCRFTEAIGKAPNYRGFLNKEFQAFKVRKETYPPFKPRDVAQINHYSIPGEN